MARAPPKYGHFEEEDSDGAKVLLGALIFFSFVLLSVGSGAGSKRRGGSRREGEEEAGRVGASEYLVRMGVCK